jgi:nondiscriminating aspartyl-tRNA synthetase
MRILAKDVQQRIGENIEIRGWLHKKRILGGLSFINVRDRTGLVQVVIEDKNEAEKLRGMQIGTVLHLTGNVVDEPRAPGGAELHDPKVSIIVPVTDEPPIEIDKPLSHKPEHLDTLFEYRAIGLRNLHEQKVFKLRAAVLQTIRDYLVQQDFTEIQSPKLLGAAPEGGTEVFKLDYFGKEATLAQSPQLYKQMMVGVFERVFEIGSAFRAEPSATTRHMSESMMLDVEVGFVDSYDEVLDFVGNMTAEVLRTIYAQHGDVLKSLNAPELVLPDDGNGIPRMTVAEVHELYTKATKTDTTAEKDLTPDEEKWICDYARKKLGSDLVYVRDFPLVTHKFYQKKNDDGTAVLSADLLFRGVEIATVPMRENDYQTLLQQMKDHGIDPEDPGFRYYLQAFRYGLPPHGGCGFGIDRFVQKLIGLSNIKEATLFPRDINRLTP